MQELDVAIMQVTLADGKTLYMTARFDKAKRGVHIGLPTNMTKADAAVMWATLKAMLDALVE